MSIKMVSSEQIRKRANENLVNTLKQILLCVLALWAFEEISAETCVGQILSKFICIKHQAMARVPSNTEMNCAAHSHRHNFACQIKCIADSYLWVFCTYGRNMLFVILDQGAIFDTPTCGGSILFFLQYSMYAQIEGAKHVGMYL